MDHLVRGGFLQGARRNPDNGEFEQIQEGRLGYEEYGARAAALLGLDTTEAMRYDRNVRLREMYNVGILTEGRSFKKFGAGTFILSEPLLLTAFEFGLDENAKEIAHRLLTVQENRFLKTGVLTAVSEDHLDRAPFFAYNSVFANGREWVAVSEDGSIHDDVKTLGTKASFGWDMIYGTRYTNLLKETAWKAVSRDRGWYAGIYETSGEINSASTANTNGIILEALHFRAFGPMLHYISH